MDPTNGDMFAKTGWQQISGKWYYFESSGAAKTDWHQSSGKWYYLDPSTGAMLTGMQKISGKLYLLDNVNGDMWTSGAVDGWKIGSNGVATKIA